MFADSITSSSGTLSAFPAGFSSALPSWTNAAAVPVTSPSVFWNNISDDSIDGNHQMNIGYLLTDTGGFAGTASVLGSDTVSQALTASGGADPAAFNLVRSANPYDITLLFADSSLDTGNATVGTVFGYYVGNTFTPIYTTRDVNSPTGTEAFNPTTSGNSYGFYATVCYAPGSCETYTTGNGNWGDYSGGAGWNHFALFQLTSGNYAIGFEDVNAIYAEGGGDFNDIVVELSTVTIPEPGTIGIMTLGLIGLLCIRYRTVHTRYDSF